MRSAFSLLELVVVVLIVSIGAAVVIPRWSDFQRDSKLASASMALTSDIRALQRHAARTSSSFQLSVSVGGSHLSVTPPVPTLLGDSRGVISYARRYSGVVFHAAQFDSSTTAKIDMRGDLVSSSTNERLRTGTVSLSHSGSTVDVDLLPVQSSAPTP